ncbi:hemoglobin subunit zeta [Microcaecilia unicolor]|uniref:Hemoglobin subunit zeta n=1 Tax=Microcaecilia unicolor TaxID=1415580 RepID=A0A6P7YL54_9AMPH|nr:hemoglobin subunit zeta [Microcaecilia unicolor]
MALTDGDKAAVVNLWSKISGQTEAIGNEALQRLFTGFPQTKTYFKHYDLSPNSAQVRAHGARVLGAVGEATKYLDNLSEGLSKLSDLHAYNLRVDPENFKLLSHCFLVVLAVHFPAEFTPQVQAAWDKYLVAISTVLTSKYR